MSLCLCATGVSLGVLTGSAAVARAHDPYAPLDLLARVLTRIETQYAEPIGSDELVDAAIRGMVDELDPHSRWLDPEDVAALRSDADGSYQGIGVELRMVPSGALVTQVFEGGPAWREGVRTGDVLTAIGGTSVAGASLAEVGDLLGGPIGSPVLLTLQREGEAAPRQVTTVRAEVARPSVKGEFLPGRIAYVRVLQFQDGTGRELEREVERLRDGGALGGLVLDLRDNPGGLLREAVAVTDLFLDDGRIVSTRGRTEGEVVFDATPGGLPRDLRVVVLVNGMSASGAEVVAGALQDTRRAVLVGTNTYGKGSVQTVFENPDHSALKLTVGYYYTPSGAPVAAGEGRSPDHVVALPGTPGPRTRLVGRIATAPMDDSTRSELTDLAMALPPDRPTEGPVPWHVPFPDRTAADTQLAFALDLLRR